MPATPSVCPRLVNGATEVSSSNLISFESRREPGGLRGPAAGLESLAAQARNVRRANELPPFMVKLLIDLEHHAETQAALMSADEILAEAGDVA